MNRIILLRTTAYDSSTTQRQRYIAKSGHQTHLGIHTSVLGFDSLANKFCPQMLSVNQLLGSGVPPRVALSKPVPILSLY